MGASTVVVPNVAGGTSYDANGVHVLSVSGVPFIKASSGTMGNNGAVSGMTALPRIFSGGAYLWLPAGAIDTGVPAAAAWYWFVASSTTAGTVYNSTYTSGTPEIGVATAFSTTGPGAFTGDTGTITAASISLPAGTLGANGRIDMTAAMTIAGGVSNKVMTLTFGNATMWTATLTTQASMCVHAFAANRGRVAVQNVGYLYGLASSAANGTSAAVDGAVDTASAVTIAAKLQTAAATDHAILDSYSITYAA